MDSSAARNHQLHRAGKCPSSRRIPSFSSSPSSAASSSSSLDQSMHSHDDSMLGPATPLRLISRIPFSWEHFPGIPKNHVPKIGSSPSHKLLPLPPPTTTRLEDRKKNSVQGGFQRDPFFAALVECSKSKSDYDRHEEAASSSSLWTNNVTKVSRSLSNRFEFIGLFASCKRTCAVSESLVHLPSSRGTRS
ncbi:uncharacterized protein LOC129300496 [Prosopis cineraria]|uniref:uncharacterized protein LOC129300496 n=1 Tax=Prosopis cineraria TaxID=364024 RepID=UPI00240F0854|nr:uncharacterized protein LOC129300496 [Prosopis cineraria]XP_054795042.1 uncharacterized protein LOC129300496 [Prosopis cineraria]